MKHFMNRRTNNTEKECEYPDSKTVLNLTSIILLMA